MNEGQGGGWEHEEWGDRVGPAVPSGAVRAVATTLGFAEAMKRLQEKQSGCISGYIIPGQLASRARSVSFRP